MLNEMCPVLDTKTIGNLLVESGKLKNDQMDAIISFQKKEKIKFGEAAVKLGYLDERDILFALSQQFDFACLDKTDESFSSELITAYEPYSSSGKAYRDIREQIFQNWISLGNKTIAVIPLELTRASSACSANLAVVFSQLGLKTIVIDADLRNPSLHHYFKIENKIGLSDIIAGRADFSCVHILHKLKSLTVLTSGTKAPNPQDLLARPNMGLILEELKQHFDVIILNCPPISNFIDSQIIAMRTKGAIFTINTHITKANELKVAAEKIISASATIIGSILVEEGK